MALAAVSGEIEELEPPHATSAVKELSTMAGKVNRLKFMFIFQI
jgi:hypothetical protein